MNVVNNKRQNPLHLISQSPKGRKSSALMSYFISQGTSTDLCDVDSMTPFLYALGNQSENLALLLLDTQELMSTFVFTGNFGL